VSRCATRICRPIPAFACCGWSEKGPGISCQAYNFALAQAHGDCLLKLDADGWPTEAFDPADPELRLPESGLCSAFDSGPEGRKRQPLIEAGLIRAVGDSMR
jgi:hypothetical protein